MIPLNFMGPSISGNEIIVKILIDKQGEIDVRNNLQQTPLHFAAKYGNAGQ